MVRKTAIRIGTLGVMGLALALSAAPASARVTDTNAVQVSNYLMEQGSKALRAKKTDEAIAFYEQAAVANPRNARAFGLLGEAYEQAGKRDKARKYYDISLAIEPDDLTVLRRAGEAALADDDLETAKTHLERLRTACKASCGEFRALDTAIKAKEAEPVKEAAKAADKAKKTP